MVRAVSTNVAPPRLLFGLPLDAGVDASKNPPFWTDATKIREEPKNESMRFKRHVEVISTHLFSDRYGPDQPFFITVPTVNRRCFALGCRS